MSRKKKRVSQVVKTIPLAVVVAALTSGTLAAAATDVDIIQVDVDGKTFQYNLTGDISAVEAKMREQLKAAFEGKDSIKLATSDGGEPVWIEFSQNADEVELDEMLANPSDFETTPDVPDAVY